MKAPKFRFVIICSHRPGFDRSINICTRFCSVLIALFACRGLEVSAGDEHLVSFYAVEIVC